MSLKVQLLECEVCKTAVYAFPMMPSAYLFETGKLLRLRSTFGWCEDCYRVQQVEDLPSAETLDREETDLKALSQSKRDGLDQYEQKKLEDIGRYRLLLGTRQHPNRCMNCGGTDIDPWVFDARGRATHNPHGGCAGHCRQVEDPDGLRLALVEDAEVYTPEGKHLGRLSEQPGRDGSEDF